MSHPQIKDSYTQSFLKNAQTDLSSVKWHVLDLLYPNYQIKVKSEQRLLMNYDRIIFQFPLYWYSAPALLKKWEDDVLVRQFANARHGGYLRHKQLGIVTTLGDPLKNYRAGASEHFSLSTLLTPYQALAAKAGMKYLPPFVISQFFYQLPRNEARILVDYQNYVSNPRPLGLKNRLKWLLQKLRMLRPQGRVQELIFDSMLRKIRANQQKLDDLKQQIDLIKRKDDD